MLGPTFLPYKRRVGGSSRHRLPNISIIGAFLDDLHFLLLGGLVPSCNPTILSESALRDAGPSLLGAWCARADISTHGPVDKLAVFCADLVLETHSALDLILAKLKGSLCDLPVGATQDDGEDDHSDHADECKDSKHG